MPTEELFCDSLNAGPPSALLKTWLDPNFVDLSFRLVRDRDPIGQGGFSDVYKASLAYSALNVPVLLSKGNLVQVVAVKVLRITHECDLERALKHLKKEVHVWSRVNHPNVAKFLGVAFVGERPAIVLRWYENGVATKFLQAKTLEEKLVIVRDVACGLAYLHSQDIVHGDIKGRNVLVTAEGRAVISDFGLSHIIGFPTGCTTSSMKTAGSVRWLSPELVPPWMMILDPGAMFQKSKASDVWAFACTAFELILEKEPYSQLRCSPDYSIERVGQHFGLAMRIASCIHEGMTPLMAYNGPVDDIPADIQMMLRRCWAYLPGERPGMEEVIALLSV